MRSLSLALLIWSCVCAPTSVAQEAHEHGAPEKLGRVSFPVSCQPEVQPDFNRGVALLHSFAYAVAERAFRDVLDQDPQCAMAHWGVAMTHFHQLWDPPLSAAAIRTGRAAIRLALQARVGTERERSFIQALGLIYEESGASGYHTRALRYERAMKNVAAENRADAEAQVFYALALLSNAQPTDKTLGKQKQAADLLEPLFRAYPKHPGIPHYLIHAYDNAELAARGLPAAREYSKIAPSAPHALHMPSHIFTRLGLWEDSIAANNAARAAAHQQGDIGEELHAMDYLVYAYLQSGQDSEAARVIQQLKGMSELNAADFKVGYASTAMPIRYAVERKQWAEAANSTPPSGAPPHIVAIAVWARGLGLSRSGNAKKARAEMERLRQIESQLRAAGNEYWAVQTGILAREVSAWSAQADGKPQEAVAELRAAADEEDSIEKLPVTPGPIVPAREQLGHLLLEQNRPDLASKEFATTLASAPGRRGALQGAAYAAERSRQPSK